MMQAVKGAALTLALACSALGPVAPALAQMAAITRTTAVPEPGAIPLPAPAGASKASEVRSLFGPGNPVVRNVTQPMLTPVLPGPAKATGAAAIVAPAGAITALGLAQTAPAGEGPAFIGYIYGPQAIDTAPAEAPPLFNALAIDDPLFHATNFPIVAAWYKAKRPVEFHLYSAGNHGFGVDKAEQAGRTHNLHIAQFVSWLRMQGLLAAAPTH